MTDHEIEDRIARQIIDTALATGCTISVHDGGEICLRQSSDAAEIMAALRSSDEDRLIFYNREQDRAGWVWLVWGNVGDLISDCSANDFTARLLEPAEDLAEQLAA